MSKFKRPARGSEGRCPKCASTRVAVHADLTFKGYGPGLALCENCRTIWEPFKDADIWDDEDALCSFKEPCNNCAFRKGSPERADPEEWSAIMDNVEHHGGFFCHKGVPIAPGAKHGFAYPHRTATVELEGVKGSTELPDRAKLRYCRGWLNAAFSKKNMAKFDSPPVPEEG